MYILSIFLTAPMTRLEELYDLAVTQRWSNCTDFRLGPKLPGIKYASQSCQSQDRDKQNLGSSSKCSLWLQGSYWNNK